MKFADQCPLWLTITGQGQTGVFQLASDGVGEVLPVAQRIDLLEQFRGGRVGMGGAHPRAGLKQGISRGHVVGPVHQQGIQQKMPGLLQ
ncbi:hypothetical protein D3C80_1692120 [compost metagenome]